MSLILCYFDINCSQPKLTFEHSRFCVSVEKSPEWNALYLLYLLHWKRGGDVCLCKSSAYIHLRVVSAVLVLRDLYNKGSLIPLLLLNFHTFDSWMRIPFTVVGYALPCH